MSFRGHVTGAIAEPVLRWTGQQRPVLEIRIAGTASQRDKDSGEWNDVGSPLWLSATFWDTEAQRLADMLSKGDRVTVEGTLVLETYQRRDGSPGVSHQLRGPRFLGMIPRRRRQDGDGNPPTGPVPTVSDSVAPF